MFFFFGVSRDFRFQKQEPFPQCGEYCNYFLLKKSNKITIRLDLNLHIGESHPSVIGCKKNMVGGFRIFRAVHTVSSKFSHKLL